MSQEILCPKSEIFPERARSAFKISTETQVDMQSSDSFTGRVHIKIPHHNYGVDIQMRQGENFMTSATEAGDEIGEYLECACGGNMSCSTCHVILDEDSFCEAELDMLDLAYEPTETSRLGCQISMSKGIDGITVTIPAGANNLWS